MKRLGLGALVCGVVVAALVYGCSARLEVAKDRLRDRIDAMLGKMDVKRKEIELGLNGLKEGIDGLRRAKIRAQVSGDQIARQAQPQEDRLASMDSALKTLRGHLEAKTPVEIAGKSYNPQELKDMADRVLSARKVCAGQLEAFHDSQGRLQKVVATLERKQQEAQTRLADIEGQVTVIDSNRIALTAMQKSAEAMGENDGSLAKGLDHLQEKVHGLFADVETELRVEDDRWAADATKEISTVDAVVAGLQTPRDTIADIDKILAVKR
jgi:chromosome segregation ATPase